MAGLQFLFSTIDTEVNAVASVAERFIARSSANVLPTFRSALDNIRGCPTGRPYRWEIKDDLPLCTKTSWGDYDRGQGQSPIFAKISCVWDIEPLGDDNLASRTHRKFALAGLASTKVRIVEGEAQEQGEELAMWRTEIGDDRSPGCCFHVQVLGESDDPPFPSSVPVPRFPSLLVTPMSVLEFVLAELFQDSWRKHAARDTSPMQSWRKIQRLRLGRLLHWKADHVDGSAGPPWTALKSAKPPASLFL